MGSDWKPGLLVAMATPGLGVALHYVPDCEEPPVLLRAACGHEGPGVVAGWFLRLPRNTKTCDRCFVTLPARRPVH